MVDFLPTVPIIIVNTNGLNLKDWASEWIKKQDTNIGYQ